MDFLHPTANDQDRVILLLLVSKNGSTHIVCYDWYTTQSLRSISTTFIGRPLSRDCSVPSVLVPLQKTTSFLLVCPTRMLVFTDILQGNGSRAPIVHPAPGSDGGGPSDGQLWTVWARPVRHAGRTAFDDIFLCREDGKSLYLEISTRGDIHRQSQPGHLGCSIDTAFAIIDGGPRSGDLLVAVGSGSSGGLFIAEAREFPKRIQQIPNWAPVLDSVTVRMSNQQRDIDGSRTGQAANVPYDRIFTCSGIGTKPGAITELRYGIEARIGSLIFQEDPSSVTEVWAFPNFGVGGSCRH
jgi:hypothetical protein